jgi:hypothetical protein
MMAKVSWLCRKLSSNWMKKLNDIACNLNINPPKFRREKCCVQFNWILIESGLIESNLIQLKFWIKSNSNQFKLNFISIQYFS